MINETETDRAHADSSPSSGSVWGYRDQREACRKSGMLKSLTKALYLRMAGTAQQEADMHMRFWKTKHYDHLGHCGYKLTGLDAGTGVCSLKRCKKLGMCKQ